VRVIYTKDAYALLYPEQNDAGQFFPKCGPLLALKIKRNDVLVALGRVLCILDPSVRSNPEPFGVLFDVRMVRGALVGDIERDLDAKVLCPRNERAEILERAELGMDGLVPALFGADRPRTARVIRLTNYVSIPTLPFGFPIGWMGGR